VHGRGQTRKRDEPATAVRAGLDAAAIVELANCTHAEAAGFTRREASTERMQLLGDVKLA